MRLYGEANDVRGLASGPIETRFARLRENTAADTLIVWTTPTRWAAGEGLSLRFPQLHLEFGCSLSDGHLIANKVAQVTEDARPPDREPGAVGVIVHPERVPLPPEDQPVTDPDVGVDMLERHFAQLAGKRWSGFAAPLRAALEAEALEDEARTQRLTVPFKDASLTHGGEEDVWRLKGVAADALRALDDGEWLEILDDQARSRTSARVIDTHPGAGTLIVGVRTAADPPRSGFIRPRSRRKILEQKRALLDELASPTGSLPNLVRLVAAPASMPTPRQVRPERFVNPAVVRNRSQARAVSLALGLDDGQALLIQGPPGTGKSTTAAEIDVQLILRDPGVRILVCSHSNHGTDNMLMKVLPFLDDAAERIARIGFYERIAKEARPFYAAADADLGDRNVIFTTIDALVLQDVAGARVYDYVILDEANRAGVLDSLLALARGKRMILVGDPMQLQPVMSEAEQQIVAANGSNAANHQGNAGRHGRHGGHNQLVGVALPGANNVIGKSLFAWIQERRFAPGATVLLDQQNRMHPAIGELVSRVFYSNRVRTGPAAPRRGTGLPAFPSPVTWVDTRSLRGNVESRAGGTSLFNVAEARLVTSITRNLASQAPPNLTIGVITAYAEQRDLLRRLMGPHDWPPERQLEIDTVDAFEGREKDIIVLSLVRANRRRDIGFLRLEQRLNVAISRSRRLLIVVGDTSTLRQGYFHHLVATCQQVGQIIPAPKLIGMFLSRGRRRHEREERRREGGPEEVAASVDGEVAASEAGATVEGGVAPVAAAGQEEHGQGGSRRRRRRAWERRRERLRAMHEQPASQDGSESEPPAGEDVNGVVPESAPMDESAPSSGPVARPRRPRRRREQPAAGAEAEAAAEATVEPLAEAATEPTVEPVVEAQPAPVKVKRTRTRKAVEPRAEPAPAADVVKPEPTRVVEVAKAEPAPVMDVAEAEPAAQPADVAPPPVRKRKSRAKQTVVEPAVVEPVALPEAAVVAEVVEADTIAEIKPARRTRAGKAAVSELPGLNGTEQSESDNATLPLPAEPPPPAELAPARRPRARRTTKAS
ncbi:MAG: AAA family ATPase [Chloroflexi bacterium]|nr:AAA family ATPase [Chloroflexota bacterium]